MNLKQIQELIKFVAKSGATEVDLEMGDVKISIKSPPKGKLSAETPIISAVAPVLPPQVVLPPQSALPNQLSTDVKASKSEEKKEESKSIEDLSNQYITVKSPIIGTFYRKPSPDKDPFVIVGDKIEEGKVIAIVEAMKLFNEIESEVSGTIIKVLIDDMSPVEYDQPLFLVDPNK